jgi:hypothetical protein
MTLMGGKRNAYSVLRDKPIGTRKLIRPRHRLKHNLKMNHYEIENKVPLALHRKLLGAISQLHGISFGPQTYNHI